ncbi:MAG: hypothetical protein HYX81_03895 [Chloroflexi bacterium]|nr:hypothetical protein [Chloroflexota bacterium]
MPSPPCGVPPRSTSRISLLAMVPSRVNWKAGLTSPARRSDSLPAERR